MCEACSDWVANISSVGHDGDWRIWIIQHVDRVFYSYCALFYRTYFRQCPHLRKHFGKCSMSLRVKKKKSLHQNPLPGCQTTEARIWHKRQEKTKTNKKWPINKSRNWQVKCIKLFNAVSREKKKYLLVHSIFLWTCPQALLENTVFFALRWLHV